MTTFYYEQLDWRSQGYWADPTPIADPEQSKDSQKKSWILVEDILAKARSGDFRSVPQLIEIYNQVQGHLQDVCIEILGDAGHRKCFEEMMQWLRHPLRDIIKAADYSKALLTWGNLSAIPCVLDQYLQLYMFEEQATIPFMLSDLLEKNSGPVGTSPEHNDKSVEKYLEIVEARYRELVECFKTKDVVIYKGALFGVVPFTRVILNNLGNSHRERGFQILFRQKFEASTGINCSDFFQNGVFQPLTAVSIVQEFLESPEAEKYEDGIRYFFGHRIPD